MTTEAWAIVQGLFFQLHARRATTSDMDRYELDMITKALATVRRETLEHAATIAERFGIYPELNIANGGPEWYRHGKDIATKLRQQAQEGRDE